MKKFLLLIFAISAYVFSYAQCTDLFFSEYVEGTANNKALEIYNPTSKPIDLAGYIVKRYSNGATTSTSGGETELVGTIQPYGTFILANGQTTSTETSPRCDSVLQAMADQLDHDYPAPTYMNGNDAITLEKSDGTIVDIFGKVGEDPVEGWYDQDSTNYITDHFWLPWTANHTLVRKASVKQGITQNPGTPGAPIFFMVHVEWDTLPGRFINDTTWSSANVWDSLGSHTCDCQTTGIENIVKPHQAFFFPNPVINKEFTVKATEIISDIEIVNVIGQTIYKENNNALRGDMFVKLPECNDGLYLVKIRFKDNKSIVKKILVR